MTTAATKLITENLDVWASAVKTKSAAGRGSSKKLELYGIKKLRELILDLAMQGLLVAQDPRDEPASVLIDKLTKKRAAAIKSGKLKKQRVSPITQNQNLIELPPGWVRTSFNNVYSLEYGNNLPKSKRSETGEFPVYGSNGIVGTHDSSCVNQSCIVVGRKGSAGALNLCLQSNCWVTDVAYSVIPPRELSLEFVYRQFHTLGLDSLGKGIKPGLSRDEANALVVDLPPLAEQHRIVAKVDELMALCDQLEQQQETSLSAHQTLVQTLLAALTTASECEGFETAWARIAEHFHQLFTTENSIEQLRQTIVRLAANGLFERFDTTKSSSAIQLSKAELEKSEWIEAGEAKSEKLKPLSIPNPFEDISHNWEVVELNEVTACLDHRRVPVKKSERLEGEIPYYGANGPVGQIKNYLFDETLVLVVEDETFIGRTKPFSYLVTGKSWVNNHAHVLRCTSVITPQFLNLQLAYYPFIPLTSGTTGRKKLNKNTLLQIPILIPPITEQHRIVAKVDQLMALCDQLKTQLKTSQTTQLQLADTLAEQAVAT